MLIRINPVWMGTFVFLYHPYCISYHTNRYSLSFLKSWKFNFLLTSGAMPSPVSNNKLTLYFLQYKRDVEFRFTLPLSRFYSIKQRIWHNIAKDFVFRDLLKKRKSIIYSKVKAYSINESEGTSDTLFRISLN